jgi:penicillin-binding protein 1B
MKDSSASSKQKPPDSSQKKEETHPRRIKWWKIFLVVALCLGTATGIYFFHLTREIQSRFASRKWSVPSRVFSATVLLYPGQDLSLSQLKEMLERRRYREALKGIPRAGEYKLGRDSLEVHLRKFDFPGRSLPAQIVRFHFHENRLLRMEGRQRDIAFLQLEPLEIARLFGPEKQSRLLISIQKAPRHLIDAVLAIEDRRFYEHPGVDWWGIARALWADLRAGRFVQGGSTITQQLIKNYFLEPERTLKRKIIEACMAITIELLYDKDEILEMYMNEIYMGQKGGVAIHGIGEAALYHFGRNVEDLTLPESATLAGMIRGPSQYSPLRYPKTAKERRNLVLKRMLELGKISPERYERAKGEPLRVVKKHLAVKIAPYFVDYVRHQLQDLYEPQVLETEGLSIYTTLHPEMASAAQEVVRSGLERLEKDFPALKKDASKSPLQAVLVVVQPKTGAVLALVGGRDYGESNFNRAFFAHRQPGSAIKPFVYLAALDEFTLVTWLSDRRVVYNIAGQEWSPRNYTGRYRGRVTLRQALEKSLNAATVHLAMSVGLEKIIDVLRSLGIQSPLKPFPSLALGAFEVTPLELAGAYAALDNDGQRPFLLSLKEVVSEKGEVQQRRNVDIVSVTTPAKAYLMTSLLEGVIERGTARSAKKLGIDFPCAGKTGTTSDYRDSWFVGYTPDLLALAWVGFDDNRSTHLSGATGALRIWTNFLNDIRHLIPSQPFHVPPGVVERTVCSDFGQLAGPYCLKKREEYFLAERVPENLHLP